MKGIYKFYAYFGRMGSLSSVFVATAEDIENLIGEEVHFGEVLGKHSEMSLIIKKEHFTLATNDEKFIVMFEELKLENGHNPFDYYDYDDEDEDDED